MAGCINEKAPRLGWQRFIKYVIWFIWLAIVIGLYIVNGGLRYLEPLYGTRHGISVAAAEEYPVYLLVVLLLFAVPLACGKRAFCHYLCWMAPFMNVGMKIRKIFKLPGIRIKVKKERCIDCKLCNKSCTMGLDIHKMVQDGRVAESDCCMCGACVDICPKQAIHYKWNDKQR